jgi:tricorn protease-like protein
MQKVFEPARVDGKLVARNVATGEVAPDSLIRYIMINQAEKTNQVLIVDTDSGKVRRLTPNAKTEQAAKDAGKMSFRQVITKRDPKVMFENLERLTKMVGRGIQPSLVVTGMAGMGKTHIIKQTLTDMGLKESTDFVHFKGRATAAGLFITLYENRIQ